MNKELLCRFFSRQTSREEEQEIKKWLENSEKNVEQFDNERKLFDIITLMFDSFENATKKRGNLRREMLKIVASIAITAITTIMALSLINGSKKDVEEVLYQTINVPIGQRINIDLPDGTNVWLNSGSTLRYPVNILQDNTRRVRLDGEAYFDVAHNEERPFIVETYAMNVKVTGTEFNLSASEKNHFFETSLLEGRVELYNLSGHEPVLALTPNRKAILKENGTLVNEIIKDYDVFLWKEGLYSFKSKHLDEIIGDLEKYYDTKIILESNRYNKASLTGKFRIKDGINSVVSVLQKELGFKYNYDKENNELTIK